MKKEEAQKKGTKRGEVPKGSDIETDVKDQKGRTGMGVGCVGECIPTAGPALADAQRQNEVRSECC